MTRAFIDSNVFLYATGGEHGLREPCRAILEAIGESRLSGETSVEVVQEAAHVRVRRTGMRMEAIRLAQLIGRACTVHPVDADDLARALAVYEADDRLSLRDALHAAVALGRELPAIVSADGDFDRVPGLRRVDPADRNAVAALVPA